MNQSDIQLYFMLSLPPSLALSLSHIYTCTQVRTSYRRSIIFNLIVKLETVVLIKGGCCFFKKRFIANDGRNKMLVQSYGVIKGE